MEYLMWRIVVLAIFMKVADLTTPGTVTVKSTQSPTTTDINECLPKPCQNKGTCTDAINGYSCKCVPGYTGKNCSININECQPKPCQNKGTCTDAINGYSCKCVPGYTGKNCSININECQPNPCQNKGTCTDAINGYSCKCVPGYTGKNCSTNINECQPNPCQNKGKCSDLINGYSCECLPGYTGKNCSTNINECQPNPCQNEGQCKDAINGYSCQCVPGYTGKNCSTNINECQSNPCQNGGTCTDAINGYSCKCVPGYTGQKCSTIVTCDDPEKVENSKHDLKDSAEFGSKVVYSCDVDYQQTTGNLTRTCGANGKWSGEPPVCVITCNYPGNVDNAKSNFTGRVILGSKVIYTCDEEYQQVTGNTTRICELNRIWSGEKLVCKVKLGADCFGTKSCVPNSLCKQYGSGDKLKCSCLEGFYDDDFNNTNVGGSCDSEKSLGETCTQNDTDIECAYKPFTVCSFIEDKVKKVCRCKDIYYDNNGSCRKRPTEPTIEKLRSTNDSIIFIATSDRRVNGTLVKYIDKRRISRNKTFHDKSHEERVLGELDSGSCYDLTFYSLIGSAISLNTTKKKYCTVPNPPLSVKVLAYDKSSISISITNGSGNFDNFNIEVHNGKSINTTNTTVDINSLQAGYMYAIHVRTQANGIKSMSCHLHQATYPNKPESLHVTEKTTTSMSFNVRHGAGMVEEFLVRINKTYNFSTSAWNSSYTQIMINDLIPGTIYETISIQSVSHNLSSVVEKLEPEATNPDTPVSIHVYEKTMDSLSLRIIHGKGNFQAFYIKVNDTYMFYVNKTNNSVSTKAVIHHLVPGTLYDKITVQAVSHNLTSEVKFAEKHATYPAGPASVSILGQNSNSISVDIIHGIGTVQSFFIMVNESYNISGEVKTGTDNTNITIPNLIPGMFYTNISIQSVSHDLTSNSILVERHATNPDVPRSILVTNQSLDSISLKLVHGDGMVQSFIIFVSKNITLRPTTARDTHSTDVTISGLIPGMLYDKIVIQSVSNELNSKEKPLQPTGTYPDIPRLHKITGQTNNTMTVDVMHGRGVVQLFYININGSYHGESSASTHNNNSIIVISKLIPGTLYNSITIQAVSNNLTSQSANLMSHSTNPNAPKSVEFTNQSSTSIIMNIIHGVGIVESFKIGVNQSYNVVKNASADDESQIVIDGLIPGTLYDKLTIQCVSHNLNSPVYDARSHATNPEQPHAITVTNQTTNTLTVIIIHGNGIVQSFFVRINNKDTLNWNATNNMNKTEIKIPKLTPGTLYDKIQIESISHSLHSEAKQMAPYSTVPDTPQSIKVLNQTTESITININHGEGGVQSFIVQVNDSFWLNMTANISSATCIKIPRLTPGILYSNINIQAQFNGLQSTIKSVPKHGTNPSQPVLKYLNSTTHSISILIVQRNGNVQGYKVMVDGNWLRNITNSSSKQRVNILGRTPGQMYRITVTAISNDLTSTESNAIHNATYPPVPQFKITGFSSTQVNMTVGITEGNVQTYTATFKNVNESISCGKDYNTTVNAGSFSLDKLTPGTKYNVYVQSYMNSLTSSSSSQTFITDPSTPKFSFSKTSVHSVSITIEKGSGCVHHYDIYVNGKMKKSVLASSERLYSVINNLDDGKTFKINVLSVSYGQNSSLPLALAAATKQDPVPIASSAVAGIVAAIVVVLLFISWRKQVMCFKKRKPSDVSEGRHNTAFDEVEVEMTSKERKRPIKLIDIASQIASKSGNSNMGFSQDFKDLSVLSPKHEMNESQIQENRPKNRYTNILPFDHSIVKLIEIEDEPGSDFINANYIPGYSSPREYIASQGPLPATLADFWRMVWEQNVSIIVMLTQLLERGRKKCELYWPEDINEKRFFGDIIVEVESYSTLPEYALRIIVLRMGDVEKRIRHYNYLAWPDMGTPKTSNNMITFVDTIRREVKPTTNGPIIVHCSAGVGRTGTFIVMDILLQELRSGRQEVDIFGTILKLRNNRVNMVQTEDQYVFIFNCIKDFIAASAYSAADSEPLYENVRVNSRKN